MSHNLQHIMIVDDSPHDIFMLEGELSDNYEVHSVSSADAALDFLASNDKPDLILLDVNMPGTNGYEACKIIKQDPSFESIDVVFLSANDTTEEIIQGLSVGAIDYIVKPYDPDILQTKVKTAMETHLAKEHLKQAVRAANDFANTMLSETSHLGSIVNFYRTSFTLTEVKDLADAAVDAIEGLGLSCVILFSTSSIKEVGAQSASASMLEIELLERLLHHDVPFLEQGNRCFCIQEDIVALIRNMPEDESKRGTLKDFLKIILEGANAKLKYLEDVNTASHQKMADLSHTINKANLQLSSLQVEKQAHQSDSILILESMVEHAEDSFVSMGLTEEQELKITESISTAAYDSIEHMQAGRDLDSRIQDLIIEISKAAKKAIE